MNLLCIHIAIDLRLTIIHAVPGTFVGTTDPNIQRRAVQLYSGSAASYRTQGPKVVLL